MSTSNSYQDRLNSFLTSNQQQNGQFVNEQPTTAASSLLGYLPFGNNQNNTTTTAEDSCFGMSTIQRYVTSIVLVILAFVCFSMSLVTLPFLAIQPTKFAFSYSMGSFLVILRFFNIL